MHPAAEWLMAAQSISLSRMPPTISPASALRKVALRGADGKVTPSATGFLDVSEGGYAIRQDIFSKDRDSVTANIVFDLDGTLIDSAPDIQGIANGLLVARSLDPIDLDTTRRFIGKGAASFIEQLRTARGIAEVEQAPMLDEFVARYDDAVKLTRPYPGVEEALERLSAQNVLGICTNKPHRPCIAVLRHLGLDRFFRVVLGGDSLPVRKPDPLPLLCTFEKMGSGPRIFVGDSETDAETAARAGVPFLLFSRGYRTSPIERLPHAAVFEEFGDLPAIVDAALGRREH